MALIMMGMGMFTFVILGLVALILAAQAKLVAKGEVKIQINNDPDKCLQVSPGKSLLSTLSNNQIFLSSACGGGGTCAQCKVIVKEGGGDLLPTETGHINKKMSRLGYRLACQVKVKNDLKIEVSPAVFGTKRLNCKVKSNKNVATFIQELVLDLPAGEELKFKAGEYIQMTCPPHRVLYKDYQIDDKFRSDWEKFKLFNLKSEVDEPAERAYSMANYPEEKGIVMLNIRIAVPPPRSSPDIPPGKMSSWTYGLNPGDAVSISGPFGDFLARDTLAEMVFIGGGAGMAPMRSHIFDQLERLNSKRKITFWYGARSKRELFYVEDFDRLQAKHHNFKWHIALSEPLPEDKWNSFTGFIHNVLFENHLKNHPAPEDCEYYICGPPLMLKACLTMLDNLGVPKEVVLFDDFGG